MPIRTTWLVQDRVILSQPVGDINEGDIIDFTEDLEALIAPYNESDMLHLIQDARRIGKPFSELDKSTSLLGVLRGITGWYLVLNIPGNRMVEFVMQISTQAIGVRTRPAFYTYDE